jgi:hypothetical protein
MALKQRWWIVGVVLLALVSGVVAAEKGKGGARPGDAGKVAIPDAVRKVLKDEFPNALLLGAATRNEGGLSLYAVVVDGSLSRFTALVSAEGVIVSIESPMETKDVPEAVTKAAAGAADGGTVQSYQRVEVRAEVKNEGGSASLAKLEKPKTVYRAIIWKGDQEGRTTVAADGKVLQAVTWGPKPPQPQRPQPPAKDKGKDKAKGK